jgi:DNA polymerase V
MYVLVDCNNFYASCERVFNPALRHRPVVVLSNNDGCVIARSNEAKALGFKMGDPYFKVKPQLIRHRVAVFSSNYTLYGDMSQREVQTLEKLAPTVEVYSIDEAFLELSGFADDALLALAAHIRRTVKAWTGIPVSVGIGPTKTLAKAASRVAKRRPDAQGVWSLITPSSQHAASSQLPVGDVRGIGRQWTKLLEGQGVTTALAFSQQSDAWLKKHLNVVGQRTAWELRGIPCIVRRQTRLGDGGHHEKPALHDRLARIAHSPGVGSCRTNAFQPILRGSAGPAYCRPARVTPHAHLSY